MIIFPILIAVIISIYLFLTQKKFGSLPSGKSLNRIRQSPNFKKGQFQNLSDTPSLTEGATFTSVTKKFFFEKNKRRKPSGKIPTHKTDLKSLPSDKNIFVWFGHSSYFIQVDGKKFLVDPVLSGSASPINYTTKSFPGSDIYSVNEIPDIDYLLISHDHWDHLDYDTIKKLHRRVKKIICGVGVGDHLLRWGIDKEKIIECDWNEVALEEDGFKIITAPSRHFSGRGFKRNQSLWMSYVLFTPTKRIYAGGDSGYDKHFETIGNDFGPFDFAILECGQYDKNWKYIHMMPEEVVQASLELKAKNLIAVHWGKFSLSIHDWDDPILRLVKSSAEKNVNLLTPMIGEEVNLSGINSFEKWWEKVV